MDNTSPGSGIGSIFGFDFTIGNADAPGGNLEMNINPTLMTPCCAPAPTFQSCIVEIPGLWPPVQPQPFQQHTHYHFTPTHEAAVPRLSDEDVERIARRVAELLKDAK